MCNSMRDVRYASILTNHQETVWKDLRRTVVEAMNYGSMDGERVAHFYYQSD